MNKIKNKISSKEVIIAIRGKLEPIKIYPVTEDELKILKNGFDGSIYLNFAIAILTSSLSALLVILTVENLSFRIQAFIDSIMFFGFIIGFLLLFVWHKKSNNSNDILKKIKARIELNKDDALKIEKAIMV